MTAPSSHICKMFGCSSVHFRRWPESKELRSLGGQGWDHVLRTLCLTLSTWYNLSSSGDGISMRNCLHWFELWACNWYRKTIGDNTLSVFQKGPLGFHVLEKDNRKTSTQNTPSESHPPSLQVLGLELQKAQFFWNEMYQHLFHNQVCSLKCNCFMVQYFDSVNCGHHMWWYSSTNLDPVCRNQRSEGLERLH